MSVFSSSRLPKSTRREWLRTAGGGMGAMALQSLLQQEAAGEKVAAGENLLGGAKSPHFPARAKRMIWLFMHGGPSQVDLFDPSRI